MKVLVAGATGFTGRRVAAALAASGCAVRCFARPDSDRSVLGDRPVEWATGDLGEEQALVSALAGCDAFVYVASLGFGHAPGVVRAVERAGVRRAVFFSTTAVFTSLPARSRTVRLAAEETIRNSDLDWTILRPTMIYGAPGDRNVERLLGALSRWPVFPLAAGGRALVQPVVVDDLAAAATAALAAPAAVLRAYCLPGAAPVPFRDFVAAAAAALGRRVLLVSVPGPAARLAARGYESVAAKPRIRAEQVERLLEDKDFDPGPARRDFGYAPRTVEEGLCLEVARLRERTP